MTTNKLVLMCNFVARSSSFSNPMKHNKMQHPYVRKMVFSKKSRVPTQFSTVS